VAVVYLAEALVDPFADPTSVSLARSSLVVAMFAFLWGAGLLLIATNQAVRFLTRRSKAVQVVVDQPSAASSACLTLRGYINEAFPSVFTKPSLPQQLWAEVKRHHRYMVFVSARAGDGIGRTMVLTAVQLLTTQAMLMFLLVWLSDFQSPSDDGSCAKLTSQEQCLAVMHVLDYSQNKCSWAVKVGCSFQPA